MYAVGQFVCMQVEHEDVAGAFEHTLAVHATLHWPPLSLHAQLNNARYRSADPPPQSGISGSPRRPMASAQE
jgi:hypothetical protein